MANKNTSKTTKKNSVTIEWPTSHFTIDDLHNKYKDMIEITLRFRVKKALENKELVVIGKIKPAIGRPKMVFAKTGLSQNKDVLETAKTAGMLPLDEAKSAITVAEVKTERKPKVVVPQVLPVAKEPAVPVVDHVPSVVSQ